MMGNNDKLQDELFYAFNLDEVVPQDHLLRDIERFRLTDATDTCQEHPHICSSCVPAVSSELLNERTVPALSFEN